MISVPQIHALLQDRNITTVSQGAGVNNRTIYRLKKSPDTTLLAAEWAALDAYFAAQMVAAGFAPLVG